MIKFQSFLSSSSGNATFVTDDTVRLLVDCGGNGKYMTECMRRIGVSPAELDGILITHEHRDHIAGAGVLSRRFNIPVYATKSTWEAIGDFIGAISPENRRYTEPEMCFQNLKIRSFSIPHDAADPVGYSFLTEHEKFTIATDVGHLTDTLVENLTGSDAVIVEANHDVDMLKNGPYPFPLKRRILSDYGHLSNECCGALCAMLAKNGTKAFWLGHLSPENNEPSLAYSAVLKALTEAQQGLDKSLSVNILPRYWID